MSEALPSPGTPHIRLHLPIDLPPGASATNWLREFHGDFHDDTPLYVQQEFPNRPGAPRWVETNLPSFLTLPEVREHYERRGYEVSFDLDGQAE